MKNSDAPEINSDKYGVPDFSSKLWLNHKQSRISLTKREHFAGLAMQGLITLKGADCMDKEITAKQCVKMADALLKELEEL